MGRAIFQAKIGGGLRCFSIAMLAVAVYSASAGAQSEPAAAPAAADQASAAGQPVVLDSVIAVINGDVLLRSDLQLEVAIAAIQPLSLPPGKNIERRATQRLVNRTLILLQMQSQGVTEEITDAQVKKDLDDLRKQIPACIEYQCQTDAGWSKFLSDHYLTVEEATNFWRQRMQILSFVDTRFRAGTRISKAEISDYYKNILAPQFKARNVPPPTLESTSSRIEEILLQQHVTALLQDWLKTLRDQGNVIILDPALGTSNPSLNGDDDEGNGE